VVVTSAALAPAFQDFVAWKKRKGIDIGIVTMEYIRANYTGDEIGSIGIYDDVGSGGQHIDHYHLGKSFTILSKAGNVAYLGNTRNGWIYSSHEMFKNFGQQINNGFYNIGVAEANSRSQAASLGLLDISIAYGHNLLGCPEMEITRKHAGTKARKRFGVFFVLLFFSLSQINFLLAKKVPLGSCLCQNCYYFCAWKKFCFVFF